MQIELFNQPPLPLPQIKTLNTCKNCMHLYRHQYRNDWKYCSKQRTSKRTAYGHKKIKCGDAACYLFEQIEILSLTHKTTNNGKKTAPGK